MRLDPSAHLESCWQISEAEVPLPLNIPGSADFQVKDPRPVSHAVRPLSLGLGFSLVDRKYWGFVAIVSVKNLTLATTTYS